MDSLHPHLQPLFLCPLSLTPSFELLKLVLFLIFLLLIVRFGVREKDSDVNQLLILVSMVCTCLKTQWLWKPLYILRASTSMQLSILSFLHCWVLLKAISDIHNFDPLSCWTKCKQPSNLFYSDSSDMKNSYMAGGRKIGRRVKGWIFRAWI